MLILALDLARRMGYAIGEAGTIPRAGAKLLASREEPPAAGAQELGRFIRDVIVLEKPDLVVVEHWLHPSVQRTGDVVLWQLHLHGALHGVLGCWHGIQFEHVAAASVRKHFCGAASAAPRRGRERTSREQREDRAATKAMVIDRAIALGYLPKTRRDDDIADACALFDYAAAHFARRPMRELVMFGEAAQ
jgi:hypothetical protein